MNATKNKARAILLMIVIMALVASYIFSIWSEDIHAAEDFPIYGSTGNDCIIFGRIETWNGISWDNEGFGACVFSDFNCGTFANFQAETSANDSYTIWADEGDDNVRFTSGSEECYYEEATGYTVRVVSSSTSTYDGADIIIRGEEDDDTLNLCAYTGASGCWSGMGDGSIYGGPGDDTCYGSASGDFIDGRSGADLIYGYGGNDDLEGGTGGDEIHGGDGDDSIYGEGGTDELYGDDDDDYMVGGTYGDTMYGGKDNDIMYGNGGQDTMYGGPGVDCMDGGSEYDYMYGEDSATGTCNYLVGGTTSNDAACECNYGGTPAGKADFCSATTDCASSSCGCFP